MKYPAILKLSNDCVVLATSLGCGFALKDYKDEYESTHANKLYKDFHGFESAANITPEYLANTYGEVQSPEHAEFIIELAKNAGFGVSGLTSRSMCFEFSGDCNVVFYEIPVDIFANNEESKQITIPLPPKQIQTATPEEEFEMKQIMKNAGDNLVLGCEDSKCDKWPKIGDEVLIYSKFRRLAEIKGKAVKVIGKCNHSDGSNIITVEHCSLGVFAVAEGSWIQKPKTPEEELRELLRLLWDENNGEFDDFLDVAIEYITKKPQ
ncbi:MAG: hypothetical protein Unbinned6437contig1000_69 [Prokaryotic dsDNA virus sp.]|nr:MAG: hypothetical protein Unbinned6437contig1000_69 [Prokaryotic dsDNA virus sp.]|tara:strand:+ start:5698 stop:6492 length:795 start_codon:yes stop_codon:yes gene_type:complete